MLPSRRVCCRSPVSVDVRKGDDQNGRSVVVGLISNDSFRPSKLTVFALIMLFLGGSWRALTPCVALALNPTPTPPPAIAEIDCCVCVYGDYVREETRKFIRQCLLWHEAPEQQGCQRRQTIAWSQARNPDSYLRNCSEVRVEYKGHGVGASFMADEAQACFLSNPNCTLYEYNSKGCSTFANRDAALKVAADIQKVLPARCTAVVSAHQCNVITTRDGLQVLAASQLQFWIDAAGISCEHSPCNPPGKHCDPSPGAGTSFECTLGVSTITQQCCNIEGNGQWIEPGLACPVKKNPALTPTPTLAPKYE